MSEMTAPSDDRYILFFAPEAGVVPHYMAHCVVAKTLSERGHKTLIVRCFDIYPRCVTMDAWGLPHELTAEKREEVCCRCLQTANDMTTSYGLEVVDLRDIIDADIRGKVDDLTSNLPRDLSEFEIDGFRLGQICGAEAAVTFKTTDFSGQTPEVRRLLVWYLEGALLSYFAMQRLLATGKVARVVHFNEYGILFAAALAARGAGVPTTFMSMASVRGVDRRRIVLISEPLAILSYRARLNEWSRWRDLYLSPALVEDLVDDALSRSSGGSIMVYSPTRTGSTDRVFEQLGLQSGRRLLVAFTSSLDEIAANSQYLSAVGAEPFPEVQPFTNQIEWLAALIARVEASEDLQLVVRIHPREGANRREATVSDHLAILREHFDREYQHVRIVWPGVDLSSYDLMELADIGLSAWSSTALEMSRFGIPALIAFNRHTPLPIGDVVHWAPTPEAYFDLLRDLLRRPPSFDQIKRAFRWTHLHLLGCAADLGDVIPDPNYAGLPPFTQPAASPFIEQVLVEGRSSLELNHMRLAADQGSKAERLEREALMAQLRRVIWQMNTGEDRVGDYRLYCGDTRVAIPDGYDAMLLCDGEYVEFSTAIRSIRRRSRTTQRLAMLAGSSAERTAVLG